MDLTLCIMWIEVSLRAGTVLYVTLAATNHTENSTTGRVSHDHDRPT